VARARARAAAARISATRPARLLHTTDRLHTLRHDERAWSLYAFLRSPEDYLLSVCTAISRVADTDTTAAMTGAMTGSRVGSSGLPSDFVAWLEDRGTWRAAELEQLARRSPVGGDRCEACRARDIRLAQLAQVSEGRSSDLEHTGS
jgi:hypothetical protein